MDGIPLTETFIVRYNLLPYEGDYLREKPLPIAGLRAAEVNADSWAHGITLLWRPPWEVGEGLSYAMSATLPHLVYAVIAAAGASLMTTKNRSNP